MNIGLIMPAKMEKKEIRVLKRPYRAICSLFSSTLPIETHQVELTEELHLVVCSILFRDPEILSHEGMRKKIKAKLDKVFEEERAWPILEHPEVRGLYNLQKYRFDEAIFEVVINRFLDVLKLINGIGDLSTREISVTGESSHLEYAINGLITKVKCINILLPVGSQEPNEAEQAFEETGIPVHITTDYEVLNRTSLWIRFPNDHPSFDSLPECYKGLIVDFGNMKIIDTKNKKIFTIIVEFSDKIKRKIGHTILNAWEEGVLESAFITLCANAWDISVTEASMRLGMRISFKS